MYRFVLASLLLGSLARGEGQEPIELWLIPHTHADVGWLETVDALSRMNVSRILDGVVANLQNGSASRKFVWDEMAFLAAWWDHAETTDAQRGNFSKFVAEGRIELVDNGWSQHDMGATTLDGMLSNWVEGHQWLKDRGFPMPKIGWSLDPFGVSATQSVLQALMGFDAWFFTRASADEVKARKASQETEFVWRASSSLSSSESELFVHIFESYYCFPHEFRFEWGPTKGSAPLPPWSDDLRKAIAKDLVALATKRAPYFRTPNVLIPWGCDYQYQNAALVYDTTDMLIDTINANSEEWGVRARYGTPSEYLDALQTSGTAFPVKQPGGSFFPYIPHSDTGAWTGYFTSRPTLKRTDRLAESDLLAAELLFARHAATGGDGLGELWSQLEVSRRNCGIVAHHDAITGTQCRAQEGCSAASDGLQLVGSHDVLGDYQRMVEDALDATQRASGQMLAKSNSIQDLTADPEVLGDLLLSGKPGLLVVHNPLAEERVTIVRVPVSICNIDVRETGEQGGTVLAQVTAELTIASNTAPYYDFELAFETSLGPLQSRSFIVTPAIGGCGGGNLASLGVAKLGTSFVRHLEILTNKPAKLAPEEAVEREFGTDDPAPTWQQVACSSAADLASCPPQSSNPDTLSVGHSLLIGDALANGQTVFELRADGNAVLYYRSKYTSTNTTLWESGTAGSGADRLAVETDALKLYKGAAVIWSAGHAKSSFAEWLTLQSDCNLVLKAGSGKSLWSSATSCIEEPLLPVVLENGVLRAYFNPSTGLEAVYNKQSGTNYSLKHELVVYDTTMANGKSNSNAYAFQPNGVAAPLVPAGGKIVGTTVVEGPVMSEVRFQLSNQHKTFFRIWHSSDPKIEGHLEIAAEIGVLEPRQELSSRFTSASVADTTEHGILISEENAYEKIEHVFDKEMFSGDPVLYVPAQYYPSQMSVALRGNASGVQLSVALDRAKGVATLGAGELEVMHHRRVVAWEGAGSSVVLDDTDRIHTEMWVAIDSTELSNRQRVVMKDQLNYPGLLHYGPVSSTPPKAGLLRSATPLPAHVKLQTVRATSAKGDELIVRLQHRFAIGEDSLFSAPVDVVVAELVLNTVLGSPPGVSVKAVVETALSAGMPKSELSRRKFHTVDAGARGESAQLLVLNGTNAAKTELSTYEVKPFELRTFLVTLTGGPFGGGVGAFI